MTSGDVSEMLKLANASSNIGNALTLEKAVVVDS
jgi:hypothetical protein